MTKAKENIDLLRNILNFLHDSGAHGSVKNSREFCKGDYWMSFRVKTALDDEPGASSLAKAYIEGICETFGYTCRELTDPLAPDDRIYAVAHFPSLLEAI